MNHPEQLFEKLINDEISREEFDQLLEGLDDQDMLIKYDKYLEAKFLEEVETGSYEDIIASKTKVLPSKLSNSDKPIQKPKDSSTGNRKGFPIAASITLFIGLFVSALFIKSQIDQSERLEEAQAVQEVPVITKSTPYRRMFRMRLDDGSMVHLNAASSISYPQHFDEAKREISISGEAFFEIERDEQRPFSIRVNDYSVMVLGTSFNVKAYKGDDKFAVTVESGSVRVDLAIPDKEPVTLTGKQKLTFSPASGKYIVQNAKVEDELSWRKGILKFDATPMLEVKNNLERWYGVPIEIEGDNIYEKTLTGTHKNENLRSVIEAITFATGTRYEINNSTIIIKN